MANKKKYVCEHCGENVNALYPRCPVCKEYGTVKLVESNSKRREEIKSKYLSEIDTQGEQRVLTGIEEFDRVMGGGIVIDSVSALTAAPGCGKTTLLLQVAMALSKRSLKTLYISGEESERQIKRKFNRLFVDPSTSIKQQEKQNETLDKNKCIKIGFETEIEQIKAEVDDFDPDFIVIDSINTMRSSQLESKANTPTQIDECISQIISWCKNAKRPRFAFVIAQMTKADEMSGPKSFEHDVDTVTFLEGEEGDALRLFRSTKNRFGAIETGIFIMGERGLEEVNDPSSLFITKREDPIPGVALTVIKEGTRPVVVEIECLVTKSFNPYPSRIATCLRKDNLNILLAIIMQKMQVPMNCFDVVINTTGNLKLSETSASLAIIMSILSLIRNKAIPLDTVFLAEVGLTGELKKVRGCEQRIKELSRLGYQNVYIAKGNLSPSANEMTKGIQVIECQDIKEVHEKVFGIADQINDSATLN